MTKRISLVLANANPVAGKRLADLVRARAGFTVLVSRARVDRLLRLVRDVEPDIVLLNLRHEGEGSLALAGALHGDVPRSKVVVMGAEPSLQDVASFVRVGVSGFIMADASLDVFVATIQAVDRRVYILPAPLTPALFRHLNRRRVNPRGKPLSGAQRLTVKERAVADLMIRGLSTGTIAGQLGLTVTQARGVINQTLVKLAHDRVEIAGLTQRRSVLTPSRRSEYAELRARTSA